MEKTPTEIAEEWYQVDHVYQQLRQSRESDYESGSVPSDTESREFAEWLTPRYRWAMAKGIQIGRGEMEDVELAHGML